MTLRGASIAPIRLYQRVISPALPRRCKYHPTCSAYAVQAIRRYGILRGLVLAGWRLSDVIPGATEESTRSSSNASFKPQDTPNS